MEGRRGQGVTVEESSGGVTGTGLSIVINDRWDTNSDTASEASSCASSGSSLSTSSAKGRVCFVCHERCSRLGPCTVCNHFLCKSCEETMSTYKGGIYSARCSICKTRYSHATEEDERVARQLMLGEMEEFG